MIVRLPGVSTENYLSKAALEHIADKIITHKSYRTTHNCQVELPGFLIGNNLSERGKYNEEENFKHDHSDRDDRDLYPECIGEWE